MTSKINLRGYQLESLDQIRGLFKAGHRVVMLYAPTGAGKTEMAMSLLEATDKKLKRSAMILDRIVLCDQTSARLQKYNLDHGVMQAGHWRNRPYERIQVCSAQTLDKRGSFPGLNLLVVDEAHATRKQTVEFIKNNKDVYVVGLSASPFTDGLGAIYSGVVSVTTTAQLVAEKHLVPLRVFIAKEIDMKGAKTMSSGEFTVADAGERGMKITGDIVEEWRTKCFEVFGGVKKTIVFCASVAHGADLAQKFSEAGFNFVQISYEDTDEFKREAVADFSRPDTAIHGLIACDILTKGFDVPDVMVGVSARPFKKSFSSHVQQMGRVMRPYPGKDYALWLDHSGNYLRFIEEWDELYHAGVHELHDGREKPKAEKSDQEKEQAKCPECKALWVGRGRVCSVCGHTRPIYNQIEQAAGEMVELKGAPLREAKQSWYSQLRTIAADRGYSDGWVAHQYKAKFGVWPRGLQDVQVPVSIEVARWEQSRRIAFAKGKARAA
jgi:DNA repair protein RadD